MRDKLYRTGQKIIIKRRAWSSPLLIVLKDFMLGDVVNAYKVMRRLKKAEHRGSVSMGETGKFVEYLYIWGFVIKDETVTMVDMKSRPL